MDNLNNNNNQQNQQPLTPPPAPKPRRKKWLIALVMFLILAASTSSVGFVNDSLHAADSRYICVCEEYRGRQAGRRGRRASEGRRIFCTQDLRRLCR